MTDVHPQWSTDEYAIRKLNAAYGHAVSHLDAGRAAAVYCEDGCVLIAGSATTGRQAIEDGMRRTFAAFRLIQLVAHGGIIDLDGDEAAARWSTLELAVRHKSDDLAIIFGRYDDRLVRTVAGWRFLRRTFTMSGRVQLPIAKIQVNPDHLRTY